MTGADLEHCIKNQELHQLISVGLVYAACQTLRMSFNGVETSERLIHPFEVASRLLPHCCHVECSWAGGGGSPPTRPLGGLPVRNPGNLFDLGKVLSQHHNLVTINVFVGAIAALQPSNDSIYCTCWCYRSTSIL